MTEPNEPNPSDRNLYVIIAVMVIIALGMWAITCLALWIVLSRLGY